MRAGADETGRASAIFEGRQKFSILVSSETSIGMIYMKYSLCYNVCGDTRGVNYG